MKSSCHRIFLFSQQDRWYAYFPRTPDTGYIRGKAPFLHSERWLKSAFDNFHCAMSCDIGRLNSEKCVIIPLCNMAPPWRQITLVA